MHGSAGWVQDDGSGEQRVPAMPLLELMSVAPSGHWAVVLTVVDRQVSTSVVELGTGKARWAREGYQAVRWFLDGKFLYMEVPGAASTEADRILRISQADDAPSPIPPHQTLTERALLPHEMDGFAPGRDPATYVLTRTEWLGTSTAFRCIVEIVPGQPQPLARGSFSPRPG